MIHTLEQSQFIEAEPSRIWDFFSDPANLNTLTPADLHFQILGKPAPMYAGQMIAYRIRVAPAVRVSWLTEIRHVVPGSYFVDEQRIGPYRLWYHEHRFTPQGKGVLMTDKVTYALPFGPLGELAHALWVKRQLTHIFSYRKQKVLELFGPTSSRQG